MRKIKLNYFFSGAILIFSVVFYTSCKTKKNAQKSAIEEKTDTTANSKNNPSKHFIDFKSSKVLTKHLRENEFDYLWLNSKFDVEAIRKVWKAERRKSRKQEPVIDN